MSPAFLRRADSASGQGGDVSNGSTNRARTLRVAAVAMWAMGILAQSLTVVNNDGENTSLMAVPGSELATVPQYSSALATVPQYGTELALYNHDVVTVEQTWFSGLMIAMITSLAAFAGAALYMGGRRVRAIAQTRAEHPERVIDHRRRETIERPLNVAPADPSDNPLAIVPFRPQNPAENRGGRETPWVPFEALTIEPLPSVGPNHGVVNRPQPQRNPQANRQEVYAPRGDFWGNIARRMNGWVNIAQNTANTVNPIRAERAADVARSDTPTNGFGENTPHGF